MCTVVVQDWGVGVQYVKILGGNFTKIMMQRLDTVVAEDQPELLRPVSSTFREEQLESPAANPSGPQGWSIDDHLPRAWRILSYNVSRASKWATEDSIHQENMEKT